MLILFADVADILLVSLNNVLVFGLLLLVLIEESSVYFLNELKFELLEVLFVNIILLIDQSLWHSDSRSSSNKA